MRKCIAREEEFDIKAAVEETHILPTLITAVYGWPQSLIKYDPSQSTVNNSEMLEIKSEKEIEKDNAKRAENDLPHVMRIEACWVLTNLLVTVDDNLIDQIMNFETQDIAQ